MKYKPYEFNPDHAYEFARHVGIEAKPKGDNLHFQICPYCHGGKNRDKGSFAISLKSGEFKCLRESCGVHGNMITLSKDFDFSLGNEVDEYYRPKKQYRKLPTPKEPIKPKSAAVEYLQSRGIEELVAEKYEITTQKDRDNVLVFPFYDEKGILQFVKYRKTDFDKSKDSAKEWCEANCKPILFGIKQCNMNNSTLTVTEGQMDSLSVVTAGIENAVSVPTGAKGFTWIPYCWDWLQNFKTIIVFGDYEKGRISLLDEFARRFNLTIKHVREEDYKDCKDANEILLKYGKEQVRKCIENAVAIPITQVVDLADVEDVDIFKLEKLKTGIHDIDRLLYGGLPFGGVHLISGKPGEGKSTLASQIMVNAREQGYKCFAYSGELPNYLFKAWMNFQVAGENHIYEFQNAWGDSNFAISKTNKQLISEWYRGNFYLYDNSCIEGNEKESLITVLENVIAQYGVRVILLDNLMTAIDLEDVSGGDKYEKQSQFVKKLSRLAIRHNVIILLVAHKRKNNFSTNENDEISGSGDIANLGLITIAYEKNADINEDQRICKVSKNRLFGKTYTQGWVLNYSEKSKRIFGNGDNPNVEFGWNTVDSDSDGFLKLDDEPSPFD